MATFQLAEYVPQPGGDEVPRTRAWFTDGDEAGVSFDQFVTALSTWAWMRAGDETTLREAATTFQVTDAVVREAVEDHPWMFLSGPDDDPTKQILEHEGE